MPTPLNHYITGLEISPADRIKMLNLALLLKHLPAYGQYLLNRKKFIFLSEKPSLRTRLSIASLTDLGANVLDLTGSIHPKESFEDVLRVIDGQGFDGLFYRSHETADKLQTLASLTKKTVLINALSKDDHPLQVEADLLTFFEHFGTLNNLKIVYIGEYNNVAKSLEKLVPPLGPSMHFCCPPLSASPQALVKEADVLYTDTHASMGQAPVDLKELRVTQELLSHTHKDSSMVAHCGPATPKEICPDLAKSPRSLILAQAVNRKYTTQALAVYLQNEMPQRDDVLERLRNLSLKPIRAFTPTFQPIIKPGLLRLASRALRH